MRYTSADVTKLGTIMGVWAHPDDETWSAGGIMATAAMNGQRVVCVTATHGEAGQTADETKYPLTRLGEVRTEEVERALAVLGVTEHYWLNYADGGMAGAGSATGAAAVEAIMRDVQPDTVLTFGPDGLTGHDDHKTISAWTTIAAEHLNISGQLYYLAEAEEKYSELEATCGFLKDIYFNIERPFTVPERVLDMCYRLSDQVLRQKLEALQAHASQTEQLFSSPNDSDFVRQIAVSECYMRASGEAYASSN